MLRRFEQFTSAISRIYKSVQKIKSLEMTAYGLRANHVMLLYHLKMHPDGLTPSQLCELCGVDKAAVSRAVTELAEKGYLRIEEIKGQRYRLPATLTPSGIEAAEHIEEAVMRAVRIGGRGLTEQERADFYHALLLIADNLKQYFEDGA